MKCWALSIICVKHALKRLAQKLICAKHVDESVYFLQLGLGQVHTEKNAHYLCQICPACGMLVRRMLSTQGNLGTYWCSHFIKAKCLLFIIFLCIEIHVMSSSLLILTIHIWIFPLIIDSGTAASYNYPKSFVTCNGCDQRCLQNFPLGGGGAPMHPMVWTYIPYEFWN